jgi:hypothetical protein
MLFGMENLLEKIKVVTASTKRYITDHSQTAQNERRPRSVQQLHGAIQKHGTDRGAPHQKGGARAICTKRLISFG